ncbi:tyrosine-type recombinase/integrase [Nocardia jiangxiensis]|uniref:Tyrosine-type recombinase/integrase n=1 Tax=Nocardia jiangxiensis TaxID=282685 RepID=A0ABW6RTI1_9NOCA
MPHTREQALTGVLIGRQRGRVYRRELTDDHHRFIAAFVTDVTAAGFRWDADKLGGWAHTFCRRFDTPGGWLDLPLDEQRALPEATQVVVTWCLCTHRLGGPAVIDYLLSNTRIPRFAARLDSEFHQRFTTMATTVAASGKRRVSRDWIVRQWRTLTRLSILADTPADQLTMPQLDAARLLLWQRFHDTGEQVGGSLLNTSYFEVTATLFHLGQIDQFPQRVNLAARCDFQRRWQHVAPGVAATFTEYLDQRATVRAESTVIGERQTLLGFAEYLAATAPEVQHLRELTRTHLEAYAQHLFTDPGQGMNRPVSKRTRYRRLVLLRSVFDHLAETGHPDAPSGRLVLPDDLPIQDKPLPKFIDDPAAAQLLRAARAHPDFFVRLSVEFLARTGLRIGEFLNLTTDAVVQIGSGYWLRVPLGKLHNDRYIPLHPQLKTLLDEWVGDRPPELRSSYLFLDRGRRISRSRVRHGLTECARTAGIGHVHPHQLRHTLATQAINRGMTLEALAALLGHKTLSMTLVYAKIANRTVANEYFQVSEKVEALYDQPKELPANAEGTQMRKLRAEMQRRMLGNGYCTRPAELDCHFETICESCTFFVTTIEFRPTLQKQRDDAASKGQTGRAKVFDGLLDRLDVDAS